MSTFDLIGADIFLQHEGLPHPPEAVGKFTLQWISNRGTKIWPGDLPDILLVDCHRCRYLSEGVVEDGEVMGLLTELEAAGLRWVHVEKLHMLDGKHGFSEVS